MATLLSWLGAAYHDVWLVAAEISHHHHHHHHADAHAHHHSDTGEKDHASTPLPDFHAVDHSSPLNDRMDGADTPPWLQDPMHFLVLFDLSLDTRSDPPPRIRDQDSSPPPLNLYADCVQPNAPPFVA